MNEITIIPLGTISPYPKDDMNCPGYMIQYGNEKILLDCGNGITSMLNFPGDLEKLHIFLTHYHKDHFSDIGALQYASYVYHNLGLLNEKIKIYLPKKDFCYNRKSIVSNNEAYSEYYDIDNNAHHKINNLTVSFEDNQSHTIETYMVKIENKDFKIIYISDVGTTNFDKMVSFCENANLIICESSFLKKHNSQSKTHLTAYDASLLAKFSRADKLLLTHFWPEEDKQLYLEEAKQNFENTALADEGKKLVLTKRHVRQDDI